MARWLLSARGSGNTSIPDLERDLGGKRHGATEEDSTAAKPDTGSVHAAGMGLEVIPRSTCSRPIHDPRK